MIQPERFIRKPETLTAIQFTGTNGKAIKAFCPEVFCVDRMGFLLSEVPDEPFLLYFNMIVISKDDWVAWNPSHHDFSVFNGERFSALYIRIEESQP